MSVFFFWLQNSFKVLSENKQGPIPQVRRYPRGQQQLFQLKPPGDWLGRVCKDSSNESFNGRDVKCKRKKKCLKPNQSLLPSPHSQGRLKSIGAESETLLTVITSQFFLSCFSGDLFFVLINNKN
jgi:hypothetical protein